MSLAAVPDIAPAPEELEGLALEAAARTEMRRALGLDVTINSPTWRALMFASKPLAIRVPGVPDDVAGRIGSIRPTAFRPDAVGLKALALAEQLQKAKPGGSFRRSVAPGKPLPVAHGARGDWARRVFLLACGPEVVPLLAGAGYLTTGDVETLTEAYPEGMEEQKLAAVSAAASLTEAVARTGADPNLPEWLNGQILTLMGEERPTEIFQALYAKKEDPSAAAPQTPIPQAGQRAGIAERFRPNPGTGEHDS